MRHSLSLLFLLAVVAGSLTAAPEEKAPSDVRIFLKRWAESMADVRSLRVEFRQTKKLRILRTPRKSRGVARLKGERLRMSITDDEGNPELELLVADGKARLYYPRLERLEIYDARERDAAAGAPFPIFGGDVESLPERYVTSLETVGTEEDPQRLLTLKPRAEKAEFRSVQLRFRGVRILSVEQKAANGDRVRMEIETFTRNPTIPEEKMTLSVPPDTHIVEH